MLTGCQSRRCVLRRIAPRRRGRRRRLRHRLRRLLRLRVHRPRRGGVGAELRLHVGAAGLLARRGRRLLRLQRPLAAAGTLLSTDRLAAGVQRHAVAHQPRHVARVRHRNPLLHAARHADRLLLGHHPAHLIRHLLDPLFVDHLAGRHRHLPHALLGHHPADLHRHLAARPARARTCRPASAPAAATVCGT